MKPYLLLFSVAMCAHGCQTHDSAVQETPSDIHSVTNETATAESSDATSQLSRGTVVEIEDVARCYRSLQPMTPEPVFVDPMILAYCRPVTEKEVAVAREELGPHVDSAVKIYMNELAAAAFTNGSMAYPAGSVIVKEKLILGDRDSSGEWVGRGNGVGGMVKRTAGFDSDHGDWEYFYFESRHDIQQGRIDSCIQCHQSVSQTDFVFGSWQHRPPFRDEIKAEADVYGPPVLLDF